MSLFAARPALGWLLLALLVVNGLLGGNAGGLALGAMVAACFWPSTPDEPYVY